MSAISSIATIALNTFREAVRDRVLYNLIIFVLLILACAIFLADLTSDQEVRTTINIGLATMLIFGVFISIFVGVSLVSKEIEKKTLYTVFSKPVGRGEFIVGKYLGLCLTLFVNVGVMGIGLSLALLYNGGSSYAGSVWGAIGLIYLQLTIVTAVAILFSSFSSPALASLLTFLVFVIGNFSASLRDFAQGLGSAAAEYFFAFLYYILPNLSFFAFSTPAAHGLVPTGTHFAGAFGYALVYVSVLICLTIVIFRRRNLK